MNRFNHDSRDVDELDAALDALAQGIRAPLDTLDRETRLTVDQLFDWAALGGLESFQVFGDTSRPPVVAGLVPANGSRSPQRSQVPMDAALPRTPARTDDSPVHSRLSARTLWSAIAWLLIAALAGGALYGAAPFFRDDRPTDPTFAAFQPGVATPEDAATTSDEVNHGGNAGRSWDFGDIEPFTGKPDVSQSLGESLQLASPPLVVGNSVIATVYDPAITDGSAFQTIRYNLETGERMWTSPLVMYGPFATDGKFVYGLMTSPEGEEESLSPGAIWLDSGYAQMWSIPWTEDQRSGVGPVVVDGTAYFSDAHGMISTLSPGDNIEDAWLPIFRYPTLPLTTPQQPVEPGFQGGPPATDLAISDDWLFVVRPSKTIVKFDRQTGEELGSVSLIDTLQSDVSEVTVQVVDNRLVATARYGPLDGAQVPASIVVFDATTLEPRIRGDIPDLRSNLVITPDWIYLAGRFDADDPIQVYRMHPVGGTFGAPISDFSAPESASLGLSLAGNTLMAIGPTNTFAFIDIDDKSVISEGVVDLEGDDLMTVFPMQLWGQTPVAVSSKGTVVMFEDADAET